MTHPGTLVFACGGTIRANDTTGHGVGTRLVTFTSPDQGHSRPVPCWEYMRANWNTDKPNKDLRMNCLIMCPCTVKASGRKSVRGWMKDGAEGFIVTCRVKEARGE